MVLSSQKVDYKDALYNVTKGKEQDKQAAANPLVENGKKMIPSVTRVFSQGRDFYVYLQAYERDFATVPTQATPPPRPMIAFVSFYKAGKKIYETQPVAVTPAMQSRLGTVPLNFTLRLNDLPPGRYDCQVTVLDPTDNKGTFWQSEILIVP